MASRRPLGSNATISTRPATTRTARNLPIILTFSTIGYLLRRLQETRITHCRTSTATSSLWSSAQPIKILLHEIAAHFGDVAVDQALGDRTRRAAVADLSAVEAAHGG